MKLKLTSQSIAALRVPPGKAQLVVWDVEPIGFGAVIGKTCSTFVVQGRVGGAKVRKAIGVAGRIREDGLPWTVVLARQRARELLGTMAGGANPNAPTGSRGGPTLRAALEFHIGKMERGENRRGKVCSPASVRAIRGGVELHLAAWLDRSLLDLTADALDDVRATIERETERVDGSNRANPPGRAAANRLLANVSAIWRSWHKRHSLELPCPVERLTPGALKPRETRVDGAEMPAWFAKLHAKDADGRDVMNPIRRDLQIVSMFTGVRTDGVRHLRWEHVDFDEDLLHIARAKGDKPYTLPMTATVREILEKRREANAIEFRELGGDDGWCFPSLSLDLKHVIAVAEVKERRPKRDAHGRAQRDDEGKVIRERYLPGVHANRRTFNSVAIEIGIPREARESLMNHEGRGVNMKHYGRPQNWDYLRTCAEQIERALWERLKPSPTEKRGRGKLRAV